MGQFSEGRGLSTWIHEHLVTVSMVTDGCLGTESRDEEIAEDVRVVSDVRASEADVGQRSRSCCLLAIPVTLKLSVLTLSPIS